LILIEEETFFYRRISYFNKDGRKTKMRQYITRRIFISIFVLFGVSVLLYSLVRLMPGDYISNTFSGNQEVTEEMITNLKELYGLNDGIVEGYFKWAGKAVRGDLGESFQFKKPVADVIQSKMWTSFWMALPSFILQLLIAIPLGIISATKQYTKTDYFITTLALVGISLPGFFFAAVLQRTFAMGLRWLPLQGMMTARMDYVGVARALDMAKHFILPITVLTITSIGGLMRYSRTNMLEVLNADYIRTARAKGLNESKVIYKHAFRNTLIPIVTMVAGMIPGLFSGAIITEGIFAIDGLGYTSLQALKAGDIPYIMGFNIFLAVLTLLGTLLSDILYAVVDPRVRLK
jgi:peptide/nickel transport system permease protein